MKILKILSIVLFVSFGGSVRAGVCELFGGVTYGTGVLSAPAQRFLELNGRAVLPHSSGREIMSSIGKGGTGYLPKTLGKMSTRTWGFLTRSPIMIGGGLVLIAVGAGVYFVCKLVEGSDPAVEVVL
ncbi:MAG: hypothetical protein HWE30_18230 [Methylocystaceae bacterium]|nr:hypothetical protein [Methylocystaceae bacterium]